jgi:hypothetical protein
MFAPRAGTFRSFFDWLGVETTGSSTWDDSFVCWKCRWTDLDFASKAATLKVHSVPKGDIKGGSHAKTPSRCCCSYLAAGRVLGVGRPEYGRRCLQQHDWLGHR